MESKICTYTETNHRLQFVKVDDTFEIRYNRNILKRNKDAEYMRYFFVNMVHLICINRQSPLSFLA